MTALDFPITPSNGDTYGNYVYNSSRGVWDVNVPGIATRFFASDTKPSPAQNGDAWFDATEGVTYIYYDDGTSSQWVETGSPVFNFGTLSTLTDTDIASPLNGELLYYDGTGWANSDLDSLDISTKTYAETYVETYVSSNSASKLLEETAERTVDYTIALSDSGKIVQMNKTGTATLTVPTNVSVGFPVGSVVGIYNRSSSAVTVSPAEGVTVRNAGTIAQYAEASLRKRDTNEWVMVGG